MCYGDGLKLRLLCRTMMIVELRGSGERAKNHSCDGNVVKNLGVLEQRRARCMHADPYVALEIVIGISSLYWAAAAGSELSGLKDKGGAVVLLSAAKPSRLCSNKAFQIL